MESSFKITEQNSRMGKKDALNIIIIRNPFTGTTKACSRFVREVYFKDLRKQSIEKLGELDFAEMQSEDLLWEKKNDVMYEIVDYCTDYLSKDKPRYLMGVGTPVDLL